MLKLLGKLSWGIKPSMWKSPKAFCLRAPRKVSLLSWSTPRKNFNVAMSLCVSETTGLTELSLWRRSCSWDSGWCHQVAHSYHAPATSSSWCMQLNNTGHSGCDSIAQKCDQHRHTQLSWRWWPTHPQQRFHFLLFKHILVISIFIFTMVWHYVRCQSKVVKVVMCHTYNMRTWPRCQVIVKSVTVAGCREYRGTYGGWSVWDKTTPDSGQGGKVS